MPDSCLHNHFWVFRLILPVGVFAAEAKSESEYSEVDEATEAKEVEEVSPDSDSNGGLESEQENVEDGDNDQSSQRTFSYDQLKTTSGKNVSRIDLKRREVSLVLNYYLQAPPMNFPAPDFIKSF